MKTFGFRQRKRLNKRTLYNEIKDFLEIYEKPLYIHAGSVNRFETEKFKDKCFEEIVENKIWKVVC